MEETIKNAIYGDFGKMYFQFKNNAKEAIKFLMKEQSGECVSALHREDIGYIDIVWGVNNPENNKGFGLKHIIEKHGKDINAMGFNVEDFIPLVVNFGAFNEKVSEKDRKVFESKMFRFVVDTKYKGKSKTWLLTAFDLRKKPNK